MPSDLEGSLDVAPLLIAVAPNGARRTHKDHSNLPITPLELAKTAENCCEAGASLIHLHVRDEANRHTLDPTRYRDAIKEIESAVGDRMIIQVTSEAAGVYCAAQQMSAILELQPRCVSLGLREIIKDETAIESGANFLLALNRRETLVQYILYNEQDIDWYLHLCEVGVIPARHKFLLLVLGRFENQTSRPSYLKDYLSALTTSEPWMVCAFGVNEQQVMKQAIALGGHARVGFENNIWMPDGCLAKSNEDLVSLTAESANNKGRGLANKKQALSLFSP